MTVGSETLTLPSPLHIKGEGIQCHQVRYVAQNPSEPSPFNPREREG
jgi:hypothetical protein